MNQLYGIPLEGAPTGFAALLKRFTDAVEAGDPVRIASLFSEDGEYHDLVYGLFVGREAIGRMFRDKWFRDAARFRWDMLEPVGEAGCGYAHWVHSFDLVNPSGGRRVVVDGVSQLLVTEGGEIRRYREWTEGYGSLLRAGASQGTIEHIMYRHDDAVRALPAAARHIEY